MVRDALPGMQSEVPAAAIRENGISAPRCPSVLLVISAAVAATLAAFLFVPWWPWQPPLATSDASWAQLDPSWAYAVNQAVAQHLIFGRDFIWTFGPFGAVDTALYHPATDALMLSGSILVAIALCAGFAMLAWPGRIYLLLLLPIVVLVVLLPTVVTQLVRNDVVLMALPFLLLLVVFRLSVPPVSRLHLPLRRSAFLCVVVMSCAVGILPLIKGTFLALAVVEGGVAVLMAFVARRRALAFGILFFGIVSLCIGWVAVRQPLTALPHFFWAQEQISAGYSQAMSMHGRFRQLLFWGVPAAVITVIFYICITRREGLAGWLVFLGLVFYLFVAFKEGFVRQDYHILYSGGTFLLVALSLVALLEPGPAIAVAVIACLGWVAIEGSATTISAVVARIENTARGPVDGLTTRPRRCLR
jgi:hypothetical protein